MQVVDKATQAGLDSGILQTKTETFFGLALTNQQKAIVQVGGCNLEHIGGTLAGQVGQIHPVLELLYRFRVYRVPYGFTGIIVPWLFLVSANAKARVCFVSQPCIQRRGKRESSVLMLTSASFAQMELDRSLKLVRDGR
ncbi:MULTISPECIES: hypothetical protein [Pseudomonas]|uniref:hypothetical protein n=1 Tax=Pseudomonas TaxID=286 RepID=UPI002E381922|nr:MULTISPECIES: hypothetical protein [unclassified Pseudomonas]